MMMISREGERKKGYGMRTDKYRYYIATVLEGLVLWQGGSLVCWKLDV